MKPTPFRNAGHPHDAGRPPHATSSRNEGGLHAGNRCSSSVVPDRRYPSLSDDGQPWFPRRLTPESNPLKANGPPFAYVRMLALLGIIAIIIFLVIASKY